MVYSSFKKDLKHIIFGRFSSDDYGYGNYAIYKLTTDQLFIDNRQIWHEKHTFRKKYTFQGISASHEQFEIAKELLYKVPKSIYKEKVKFYGENFGAKLQDNLIIELYDGMQTTSMSIDDYIMETKKLPKSLRRFRTFVEALITKIENSS